MSIIWGEGLVGEESKEVHSDVFHRHGNLPMAGGPEKRGFGMHGRVLAPI